MAIGAAYGKRERVALAPGGERRTKQSFRDECDINKVVERYARTGMLPPGSGVGRYVDCSNVTSYLDAVLKVKNAEDAFNALPAKVRDRFKNSPEAMIRFVLDRANRKEAQELGLVKPDVVATPPNAGVPQPDKSGK